MLGTIVKFKDPGDWTAQKLGLVSFGLKTILLKMKSATAQNSIFYTEVMWFV
jgi:hypothetical protein